MMLPRMQDLTPGEGGAIGIAASLAWIADNETDWRVKVAALIGAALVACVAAIVTARIRNSRTVLVGKQLDVARSRVETNGNVAVARSQGEQASATSDRSDV